jgi:hypothetical protein
MDAKLSNSELKQFDSKRMEDEARVEGKSRPCPIVSIVRSSLPRNRIHDRDNLIGGTKSLTDLLRLVRLIEADDEDSIKVQVEQRITKNPQEVGTLVTIIWP